MRTERKLLCLVSEGNQSGWEAALEKNGVCVLRAGGKSDSQHAPTKTAFDAPMLLRASSLSLLELYGAVVVPSSALNGCVVNGTL